jgi:hypothetical protein
VDVSAQSHADGGLDCASDHRGRLVRDYFSEMTYVGPLREIPTEGMARAFSG